MNQPPKHSLLERETRVTVRKTRVIGLYLLYVSAVFFVASLFSCMIGAHYNVSLPGPNPSPEKKAEVDWGIYLIVLMSTVSFGSCLFFAYWGIHKVIHPDIIKKN